MGRKRKGEVLRTERSPMMCQKEHDKEEMGRPIKRQFFDFNVPSTTQGHLRTLVKKKKKNLNRPSRKERKKSQRLKEPCKSTKENRTPKVEKLSGTQS